MFSWASINLLFSDPSILVKIFALIILSLMLFTTPSLYYFFIKIFSANPEFKITKDNFIVYDHPKYSIIPFSDIKDCKLYRNKSYSIGLFLKNESNIEGNSNELYDVLVDTIGAKVAFLSLEFADIKPEKLLELIKERINKTEKVSS